tara:strand:+ start:3037 stop:3285 length:249 start_codon:yes stop_codon:yes gene_type:complete
MLDKVKKPDDFLVIPEAWIAVSTFLKVQTQWRTDQGVLVGLDYGALRWVIDLLEIDEPLELLADIQVIEAKIITILCERNKQ